MRYRILYNEHSNTYRIQRNYTNVNDKWETYGIATCETESYKVLSRLKQADEEARIRNKWDVIHEE